MVFRVLGPLEVAENGVIRDPLRPRERALLCALLVDPGATLTSEALADAIWAGAEPASWRKSLQMHVLRIRDALGRAVIATSTGGYRLAAADVTIDAVTLETAAARADGVAAMGELLTLWRGRPYDELDEWPAAVSARRRLSALHDDLLERRAGCLGHDDRAIDELERLVAGAPQRERRWALLMLALYRSGRRAESLRAFDRARKVLAEEFGIAPGPDLVLLERAVLDDDPRIEPESFDVPSLRTAARASVPGVDANAKVRNARVLLACGDARAALDQYELAVANAIDQEIDERALIDLWVELARAARASGEPSRAVDALLEGARVARLLGDVVRLATCALTMAGDGWITTIDPSSQLIDLLEEALAGLSPAPTPLRARLLARLAVAESHSRPVAVAERHSSQALALATVLDDPETRAIALQARLVTNQDIADLAERRRQAVELLDLGDAFGEPAWRHWAMPMLARVEAQLGDMPGALHLLEDLACLADETGDPVAAYHASARLVLAATIAGDFRAAEVGALAVREAGDRAHVDPTGGALAYFGTVGILAVLEGRVDPNATPNVDLTFPQATMQALFIACGALVCVQSNNVEAARRALEPLTAEALVALPRDLYWPSLTWMLGATLPVLDDAERAGVAYSLAAPYARVFIVDGAGIFLGSMHHHLGLLAAAAGAERDAIAHLDAAVRAHRSIDATYWTAKSEHAREQLGR
jgi:DNA-binding SARP family transcriptional activator